jgi:hypothetical protein
MIRREHNVRLISLQHEVASAALSGVTCDDIDEQVIAPSAVSAEEKAALRLYSLSFLSRFELRRRALDQLQGLSLERDDQADRGEARNGRLEGVDASA